MHGEAVIIIKVGANQARKRGRSLFNCISVTDVVKIIKQNENIGKGLNVWRWGIERCNTGTE